MYIHKQVINPRKHPTLIVSALGMSEHINTYHLGFLEIGESFMADMQIVLAGKSVAPQYVEMKVPLYSYGCENKVKKALAHLRGIHSVEVDYHLQKVTVWGICNRDDVLATMRRKRREARFWNEAENEVVIDKSGEQAGAEKARKVAILSRFKFRRSWKKLFPLVLVR